MPHEEGSQQLGLAESHAAKDHRFYPVKFKQWSSKCLKRNMYHEVILYLFAFFLVLSVLSVNVKYKKMKFKTPSWNRDINLRMFEDQLLKPSKRKPCAVGLGAEGFTEMPVQAISTIPHKCPSLCWFALFSQDVSFANHVLESQRFTYFQFWQAWISTLVIMLCGTSHGMGSPE